MLDVSQTKYCNSVSDPQGVILQVPEALQISRRTFSKIQQNLCWAFAYNLIGLPIAAGALLPAFGVALTPSMSGEPSKIT